MNGEKLDAVSVRHVGPGEEPKDPSAFGIGKETAAPDYRLDVVYSREKFKSGVVLDTSASAAIRFVVSEDVPVTRVKELVLVEVDKVNDDVLTRAQFTPPKMSSGGYEFTIERSRSFAVGVNWFFNDTALGKVIAAAIFIGVLILVLASFAG